MYSVNQHWDPLKSIIVGRSYSPEFYSFVKNSKTRAVLEKIAQETEEDYQKLVDLLVKFGVKVLRPVLSNNHTDYLVHGKILPPPMCPRDWTIMLGDKFYFKSQFVNAGGNDGFRLDYVPPTDHAIWGHVLDHVREQGNEIINDINVINPPKDKWLLNYINGATTTRIGKDLYFGTNKGWWTEGKFIVDKRNVALDLMQKHIQEQFPDYRCHVLDTEGHSDAVFCPVKPGLIVSLCDVQTYSKTFPGWEIVYLPNQSWELVKPFLEIKKKNGGKWWVPGEELNDEFTDYVESWLNHWVGYAEETVFDVNMLVIDEKNVVCCGYNKTVFNAFERHGITPHIVNFRHRYFWDGGLHCITSDINRVGTRQDYFPSRTID